MAPQRPHERVTTQNLLVSAASFEGGKRKSGISLQALTDLATLIELYCLYDRIVLLGRAQSPFGNSEFLETIRSEVITVKDVEAELAPVVSKAAARHMALALGETPSPKLAEMIEETAHPGIVEYGFSAAPDTRRDVEIGVGVLREHRLRDALSSEARAYMFVRRTFLYLGYANATGRIFTPDYARVPVLTMVVEAQRDFTRSLRQRAALAAMWENAEADNQQSLMRVVPPLSARVFQRAGGDSRRIGRELKNLRSELADLRHRLREHEFMLQSASEAEARRHLRLWEAEFKALEPNPGAHWFRAKIETVLNGLPELAGVLEKPTSIAAWMRALPKTIPVVREVCKPLRLVELHSIAASVPSREQLEANVRELFGHIEW